MLIPDLRIEFIGCSFPISGLHLSDVGFPDLCILMQFGCCVLDVMDSRFIRRVDVTREGDMIWLL